MKKIYFLVPEKKGGPYFIYKDIVDNLKILYPQQDIRLLNTKKDWIKLQLGLYGDIDTLLSVVPFIIKPLRVKNYIFNPQGNWKIERFKSGLGNKLLFFSDLNLVFSDKILLSSYFLAEKLSFKDKYRDKIVIIPNPITLKNEEMRIKNLIRRDKITLLTVSSTKFLQKAMGLVDLGKQLAQEREIRINWIIIAGGNKENHDKVKMIFDNIDFGNNIDIQWFGWIEKSELEKFYEKADIFVYGTRLENFGQVVLEAASYGLPLVLLDFEVWKYIYPDEIITNNIPKKIREVLDKYEYFSKMSIELAKKYDISIIIKNFINLLSLKGLKQ